MTYYYSQAACEETYASVEAMIQLVVNKHVAKHGGDREELMAEACHAFMLAYLSYTMSRAAFTTWVWIKVWSRLMDDKKRASRHAKMGVIPSSLNAAEHDPVSRSSADKPFDRDALMSELGRDGTTMVRLVLDSPGELRETLGDLRKARGGLRRFLQREMGWTTDEITRGFSEVRDALGWDVDAGDFAVEQDLQLQFTSWGPGGREW